MTEAKKPVLLVPAHDRDYHFGWVGGGPRRKGRARLREQNARRARAWKVKFGQRPVG